MALIKCKECGEQVSNKAKKCPKCGAPIKGKGGGCATVIVFFLVILGLVVVASFVNTAIELNSNKVSNSRSTKTKVADQKENIVAALKREYKSIEKFDVSSYLSSKDRILIAVALISTWSEIVDGASKVKLTGENQDLLQTFKAKLVSVQLKAFPKLRDAYGPALRRVLWEHDLSAKTFGKGFRVVQFVGGAFAANRNIKTFQEEISITLRQMRFTQSRYKWFKDAEEYTYYDLDSPPDDAVVVWSDWDYRLADY